MILFCFPQDVFAKALAAEVSNGIFSALPEKQSASPRSFTTAPARGTTRFRMPTTFAEEDTNTVTPRSTARRSNTSGSRRTTPVSQRRTNTARPNIIKSNNQENLTPITSQASSSSRGKNSNGDNVNLRRVNKNIRQKSITPETTTEFDDPTGFAPRAPPKTAKQFNPFAPNKNAKKQQLAKFQIRPKTSNVDTTGFAPRAPPPNAKKFNPVPTKKPKNQFAKTTKPQRATSSLAKEFEGFVPVSPPATAPQFNPVPGTSNTPTFNFQTTVPTTLGFTNADFTTISPFDYTNGNFNSDYDSDYDTTDDYDYINNIGKALLDDGDQSQFGVTADYSDYDSEDYAAIANPNVGRPLTAANAAVNNAQNQINVLGALSSTGNILNSPKYNKNKESQSNIRTTPRRRVTATTQARQATTSRPQFTSTRQQSNFDTTARGPSAPTGSSANGRSPISDQIDQFSRDNSISQSNPQLSNANSVATPVQGRENFGTGVPLRSPADTGLSLQQLDSQLPAADDFRAGRQLVSQAVSTLVHVLYFIYQLLN